MRREAIAGRRHAPRLSRVASYFREVMSELKKVVWPTRQETRRLTLMVLAIAGAVGVLLSVIDYGFTNLFRAIW